MQMLLAKKKVIYAQTQHFKKQTFEAAVVSSNNSSIGANCSF